jgi:hypothetical protein
MKYTEGKTKTNTKPPAKTPRPSINPAPQKPVKVVPLIEQIILVHYIDVGNISMEDVEPHIQKIAIKMRPKPEEQCHSYFIPIRNGDTRVECINPKLIGEDEFKKAKDTLDKAQEEFTKVIDEVNKKRRVLPKVDPKKVRKLNEGVDIPPPPPSRIIYEPSLFETLGLYKSKSYKQYLKKLKDV